jgi:hypothetical protein
MRIRARRRREIKFLKRISELREARAFAALAGASADPGGRPVFIYLSRILLSVRVFLLKILAFFKGGKLA